jgi:hypothetical protein
MPAPLRGFDLHVRRKLLGILGDAPPGDPVALAPYDAYGNLGRDLEAV